MNKNNDFYLQCILSYAMYWQNNFVHNIIPIYG